MLVQVITLNMSDGDPTTYVDVVGTERAAESYFMLDFHRESGGNGTLMVSKLVEVSQ